MQNFTATQANFIKVLHFRKVCCKTWIHCIAHPQSHAWPGQAFVCNEGTATLGWHSFVDFSNIFSEFHYNFHRVTLAGAFAVATDTAQLRTQVVHRFTSCLQRGKWRKSAFQPRRKFIRHFHNLSTYIEISVCLSVCKL